MTVQFAPRGALGFVMLLIAAPAVAAPLPSSPTAVIAAPALSPLPIDYRPYYHCHGPKRCHGKGNYYTYTPSDAPLVNACRYGRGCGYNNGWNSPSARDQYTGRRWHKHRHRRR